MLLASGFIITSTGITGLYIGKVFEQVKGRPLFIVDREIEQGTEHRPSHAAGRREARRTIRRCRWATFRS